MISLDSLRPWFRLHLLPSIGPRRFRRLLGRFETPDQILGSTESQLTEVQGINPELARSILRASEEKTSQAVEREIAEIQKQGAQVYTIYDQEYPESLRQIPDPPCLLYVRGSLIQRDEFSVAIVGTRKITHYGKAMSRRFGLDLAKAGMTVVSGFARGADTEAHRGALEAGGRTLAVFGNGLSVCYPKENHDLLDPVAVSGALISELPMMTGPLRENFPLRNRLISALSLGTLVIEAPKGSGALITAKYVAEHGKHLFALPGRVGEAGSVGPNSLIREGAILVESADDILREMASLTHRMEQEKGTSVLQPIRELPSPHFQKIQATPLLDENEMRIIACLSHDPISMDQLCRASEITPQKAAQLMLELELRGLVARMPGMRYVLSTTG